MTNQEVKVPDHDFGDGSEPAPLNRHERRKRAKLSKLAAVTKKAAGKIQKH